jgi:hypothetical protein
MHRLLLATFALASLTVPAAPAGAMDPAPDGFSVARSGPSSGKPFFRGCAARSHHHAGIGCGSNVVFGYYGGEWARYNNRSWESASYNDWWHDRPERAFPRWMQSNQDCARMWWSGGGWRC